MSSGHWRAAIGAEVDAIGGVDAVKVGIATKLVRGVGSALDDAAVRQAIDETGHAAAHSSRSEQGDPMSRIRRAWRYIIDRPLA
jgi:copper chaperone CopZ